MWVKKKQLEPDTEQQTGSKLEKGVSLKAVYCHLAYLIYMQSTSCEMLGWMKHKLESRLLREISITSDKQMTTLMAESEEELKSLLRKLKEESEKAGLKPNVQKIKIMASGPITSWQTDGETMETVTDFISGGSKITADGDCSHEIKRRLLLGKKAMTNLAANSLQSFPTLCDSIDGSPPGEHIKKQRHYFSNKGPFSQSYGFSSGHVWM